MDRGDANDEVGRAAAIHGRDRSEWIARSAGSGMTTRESCAQEDIGVPSSSCGPCQTPVSYSDFKDTTRPLFQLPVNATAAASSDSPDTQPVPFSAMYRVLPSTVLFADDDHAIAHDQFKIGTCSKDADVM